jgi:hypothetical protein
MRNSGKDTRKELLEMSAEMRVSNPTPNFPLLSPSVFFMYYLIPPLLCHHFSYLVYFIYGDNFLLQRRYVLLILFALRSSKQKEERGKTIKK